MISAWLDRSLGAAHAEIVANTSGLWPADIIGEILTEQRQADRTPRLTPEPPPLPQGKVIDFASRRPR